MLAWYLLSSYVCPLVCLSVCPSVHPSQAGILSKRLESLYCMKRELCATLLMSNFQVHRYIKVIPRVTQKATLAPPSGPQRSARGMWIVSTQAMIAVYETSHYHVDGSAGCLRHRDRSIQLIFWHGGFFLTIPHCDLGMSKNWGTLLRNFVQNSRLSSSSSVKLVDDTYMTIDESWLLLQVGQL